MGIYQQSTSCYSHGMSTCSPKRNKRSRCQWCTDDPLYINYHDTEWGIPLYNGLKLFAMLQLEGMQAGLNWLTILKKREAMTRVFCNFNPKKLSELPIKKREALILNPEIIRNKLKINAVFQNSEAYLEHFNAPKPFSQWLWDFVDNTPHINHWKEIKDIPTQTDTQNCFLEKYTN